MGHCSQIQHHLGNRKSKFTISVPLKTAQDEDVPLCTSLLPSIHESSVSGLGVELVADVVDDLGHKFVEVVKLIHEEGVLLIGVRGDVLQLVLGCPGDANGVGDHTWKTGGDSR